ncbi:MAG TPA: DMT family protein [Saprospiraceae bacterium]|nr:DMT family protein [Saprospiraceae bacterium]HND87967.1 DMT family protein [Saprospiraceae bacterium]HNG90008.1 DMT family protein [Saprospiraceae bacterium]
MMRSLITIGLLVLSNVFMTFAWYGHLKFQDLPFFKKTGLAGLVVASWLIAFLEYCLMVPANRMGYRDNGGPFTLVQLKVIQEVITLLVFAAFTFIFFKNEALKWNHFLGFALLVLAVYFIRK